MELRELRYFIAVYEELSISAAAKRCYVSQPSVSAALHNLEESLTSQLFVRHPKGVTPSHSGHKLYPYAKKLCGEAKAIHSILNEQSEVMPLRLALKRSLGVKRTSALLKEITRAIPEAELTLVSPDEPADGRIVTSSYVEEDEIFMPLWHDKYVLVAPHDHAFALKDKLSIKDLQGVLFISRSPCEAADAWQQAMEKNNVKVKVCAHIRTVEYAMGLVSAGVGVAIIPDGVGVYDRDDLIVRDFTDMDFRRTIGFAYRKNHAIPAELLSAIEVCKTI